MFNLILRAPCHPDADKRTMGCPAGATPASSQEGGATKEQEPPEVQFNITADHSYAKYLRRRETAKPGNTQEEMRPVCRAVRKTLRTACKDSLPGIKPTEGKQVAWPKSVVTYTGKTIVMNVVNRRNRFGESLLHKAVMERDIRMLRDILKLGTDVNVADNAGWSPLHEAALSGQYEACVDLIQAAAQVNTVSHNGVTPLHDAIRNGHDMIAELLLEHGANPLLKDKNGETAFDINTKAFLQLLMMKNIHRHTATAGSRNKIASEIQCVYNTRGSKVGPSKDHGSAKDSSVQPSLPHPPGEASKHIHPNQPGSKDNTNSGTVNYKGKVVTVINVNRKDGVGQTLLHKAAKEGNIQMMKQLLLLGADANMTDNAGWTPLHEAALCGHYEVSLALIKAGALVSAKACNGVTPLQDAIANGHMEIAEALKQGANTGTNDEGRQIAAGTAVQPFLHKTVGKNRTQYKREDLPALTHPHDDSMEAHADTQLDKQATESNGELEANETGTDRASPPSQNFSTAVNQKKTRTSPEVRANSLPSSLLVLSSPPEPTSSSFVAAVHGPTPPQSSQDIQLCSTPLYASFYQPRLGEDSDSDQTLDYLRDSSDESEDWALKATQNFNFSSFSMEAHGEDTCMYTFPTEMV